MQTPDAFAATPLGLMLLALVVVGVYAWVRRV